MKDEVLRFIKVFQSPSNIELFTKCACYWFAKILHERFPNSRILYNVDDIHFATWIDGDIYDITGDLGVEGCPWYDWEDYKRVAPDADEIERFCVQISD